MEKEIEEDKWPTVAEYIAYLDEMQAQVQKDWEEAQA